MIYDFWRDKRVFITGHTGFKGLWLSKWLDALGAKVTGYSLPPDSFSLYSDSVFSREFQSVFGDIRDKQKLEEVVERTCPEIVFHLAAQAIVREAWTSPAETFSVNVIGSVNLLDTLRNLQCLRAAIVVTSDKVYENRETSYPYKESDPLGGDEPYAASKAAVELAVCAYRKSYFKAAPGLATARASNVYGGGDLHYDRLIPYLIDARIKKKNAELRNPNSVRPWQYILDLLNGYMSLARYLYESPEKFSGCWNFGPLEDQLFTVGEIFGLLMGGDALPVGGEKIFYEAGLLMLNSQKSRSGLAWRPMVKLRDGLMRSVDFYERLSAGGEAADLMESELRSYMKLCGEDNFGDGGS